MNTPESIFLSPHQIFRWSMDDHGGIILKELCRRKGEERKWDEASYIKNNRAALKQLITFYDYSQCQIIFNKSNGCSEKLF